MAFRLCGARHRLFLNALRSIALAAEGGAARLAPGDATQRAVDGAAAVAPDRLVRAGCDAVAAVVMAVIMAATSPLLAAVVLAAVVLWNAVGLWRDRELSVAAASERDRALAPD